MINFIDCGKTEFIERVKNKKIYCFGAGAQLKNFFDEQYGICVEAIIDNYCYEKKQIVKIGTLSIPIISIETFKRLYTSNCIVIITCLAFDEIIKQLDSIEAFQGMDCYISIFVQNYTEHTKDFVDYTSGKELIPRKIHYCWFGGKEIPKEYKKNIDSWKRYCPNYRIIRWDESNYDIHKSLYISQAYEAENWAFVTDYARVDILSKEGGLYFDTDVELIKSFDKFLNWRMFCGFESNKVVNWGVGFGAVAGEPILQDVLEIYDHMPFIQENGTLNLITCPMIQSKIMKKYGFQMNGQFQSKDKIAIYPKEFFSPYDYIREFGRITENTHSIHHYSASWQDSAQLKARSEIEKKIVEIRKRSKYNIIRGRK